MFVNKTKSDNYQDMGSGVGMEEHLYKYHF